jgi:predicted RNase H-like HicB family nuclease
MTAYLVIYEQAEGGGWSAHTPDLPGCYAAAGTKDEVEQLMREAIPFHVDGMREAGQSIPEPTTSVGYIAA